MDINAIIKDLKSLPSREGMTTDKLRQAHALMGGAGTDDPAFLLKLVQDSCERVDTRRFRDFLKASFAIDYQEEPGLGARQKSVGQAYGVGQQAVRAKLPEAIKELAHILEQEFLRMSPSVPALKNLVQHGGSLQFELEDFAAFATSTVGNTRNRRHLIRITDIVEADACFVFSIDSSLENKPRLVHMYIGAVDQQGVKLGFSKFHAIVQEARGVEIFLSNETRKLLYFQRAADSRQWGHAPIHVLENGVETTINGSSWGKVRVFSEHSQLVNWQGTFGDIV